MAQDEQKKEGSGKGRPKEKESKSKEKPPTKVVIRRLPPTMTEEVFLEQIDPLPENDYFYYVKGEIYVGVPTFSRAYINFKNQEDIFMFQDKFDGYIFVDQRGNEFPALVEFAPYQKIPRQEQQTKEDKCNTIDNDAHYLEFLQKLENPEQFTLPSAEVYLEQIEQKERELKSAGMKVSTPLVEFIINRRQEKEKYREEKKEERRRKEIEKKKQRELERTKRKENKGKEGKGPLVKGEEKATFKVLKNTERTDSVVSEKGGAAVKEDKKTNEVAAQSTKKPREDKPQRSKELKSKERPPREKKDNQRKTEKKAATGESSEKKDIVKQSDQGKDTEKKNEVVEEPTATVLHEKKADESGDAKKSAPEEQEDRTEGEKTEGKPERVETERERKERIRNKDRPAMQIYRPGAKRTTAKPGESSSETPSAGTKRDVKTRTFTRSAPKE